MPLISPGDIIIGSLRHYRRHLRAYAEFSVWFGLVALLNWTFGRVAVSAIDDKMTRLFAYLIFLVPIGLAVTALTVAMIDHTAKTLRDRRTTVQHSLLEGVHKMLPMLWLGVMTGTAIFGATLLLIIPGFLAYFWYRFAGYALVEDDRHGMAAMTMSRRAVRGRFWGVVGRLCLTWIALSLLVKLASSILFLVLGAAVGDPSVFFAAQNATALNSDVRSLLVETIPQIVYAFSLPLFITADLILWKDLKRRQI